MDPHTAPTAISIVWDDVEVVLDGGEDVVAVRAKAGAAQAIASWRIVASNMIASFVRYDLPTMVELGIQATLAGEVVEEGKKPGRE